MNTEKIIDVKNLEIQFNIYNKTIYAVNRFSFFINKGETVAIIGESGCGKSATALSIMRLLPVPPAKVINGEIYFHDKNLLTLSEQEMHFLRGKYISMIFQNPISCLNPVFTIKEQLTEIIQIHKKISKNAALEEAVKLLELVRISNANKRINDYPHQFSGGMCQRVMIAMALASDNLELLIADEPTTALDTTTQYQILNLIRELIAKKNLSLLLITHNIEIINQIADRVIVLYLGQKIEEGTISAILKNPSHPYTQGLFNSLPCNKKYKYMDRIETIPGSIQNEEVKINYCNFIPRCKYYNKDVCNKEFKNYAIVEENHFVLCHQYDSLKLERN